MRGGRLIAAMLGVMLLLGSGIAFAQAAADNGSEGSSNPASSEAGTEIVADRTATSDTYRLPDDSLETRVFASPVNYETPSGEWKPIDEELEEQADGTGLTNGANAFELSLPERVGAAPVRLSTEGQWVSYRLLDPPSEPVQAEGNTASYEAADPGTSFDLTSLATGLKEDIEIADPSQPHVFRFVLEASAEVAPTLAEDGSIEFRDQGEEVLAVLPAPLMLDSTPGEPKVSRDVRYELAPDEGGWRLTIDAGSEWLSRPDLNWPVDIDPTLKVPSPTLDCNIGGKAGELGWGLCGSGGRKELALSYKPQLESSKDEWSRALLRYSLSSVPADAYVNSATLNANAMSTAQNTSGVEVAPTTKSWTSAATWKRYAADDPKGEHFYWTNEGGDYSTTLGKVLTSERGSQAGWWSIPLTASVVEESEPKETSPGHITNGPPLSVIAKLIDDKSRECSASCTQRSLTFESSAAPNPENRPYLSVVYYQKAPATSKVSSPAEGTVTARRLKLRSSWESGSGVTGVSFQYREGSSGRFQTIPTSLARNAKGEEVKWPLAVTGQTQSEAVYFDAAHATAALRSHGGTVEVRALFDGGTGPGYSVPVKATVNRFIGGPKDATADVGPGSVDLLTGNFTVSRTDVSIPGFGSALEFARTDSSRDSGTSTASGVLGQGWKPGSPVEEAGGAEWRSVKEYVASAEEKEEGMPDYAILTDLEGYEYAFEKSGESYLAPPEFSGWQLAKESGNFVLKDPGANSTTFSLSSGSEYLPSAITQAGGSANSTQMAYELIEGKKRLKMVIAPTPAGLSCSEATAKTTVGCRSLAFTYVNGTHLNPPFTGERLSAITYYGPTGPATMSSWQVARYAYNGEGRLTEEWDPRISSALAEKYTYEAGGQLRTITPPGQEPWMMEYGSWDEEEANGRLVAVKRASLVSNPTTAQTTIAYGAPVSGPGAPYEMGGTEVAKWGQQDVPIDATAIFPPDEVPANPPSSYAHATVYYMDSEGQNVNVATPSGAGTSSPSITTSETDEFGNVVRELSAQNRLRALAAENTVKRAEELEAKRVFSADGTELREEFGPMHQVRLESGATKAARLHRVVEYEDQKHGWPGTGPNPHLPTREVTGASIPGEALDADPRETETRYDWTLRQPTETIADSGAGGLKLTTRIAYNDETGLPTERSLPAKPEGGDAHTTKTIYYTVGENPQDASCGHNSGYANLPCKVTPAKQPGTTGQPEILVSRYASYNQLGEPTETIESPGGKEETTRKAITTYDSAGRETNKKVVGGGTALSPTQTLYSSTTGLPVESKLTCEASCEGFDSQATITAYDALGRPKEYLDADGNLSTLTYDLDGRPVTSSDGKGTQTRTYDATSGLLTKLEDSAAGTFTAAYNADGSIAEQGLPNGLLAKTTYDETGAPTSLTYTKTTSCAEKCTWLEESQERSIYGQVLAQTSLGSSQQYSYDKAGRLTLVKDTPSGGSCTTRQYFYEADSNRTKLTTRAPGVGGACDTSSEGTSQTYKYDAADRLIEGPTYDSFGRITSLPAADAGGGSALTTSFFSNNMVASQSQGGLTNSYQLDSAGRPREVKETGSKELTEVFHYAGGSDSPAWTARGTAWTRYIGGIGGLGAIQDSATGVSLQLADLHGDVVATASLSPTATEPTAKFEFDEFGNPKSGSAGRFGWLGGKQRRAELPSGVIQMGVRSYVPAMGRFISVDPVPGGSANAYDYAKQDPVNGLDLSGTVSGCGIKVSTGSVHHRIYAYAHYDCSKKSWPFGHALLKVTVKFERHSKGAWDEHLYGPFETKSSSQWKPRNSEDPKWRHWKAQENWRCGDLGREYRITYELNIMYQSPVGGVVHSEEKTIKASGTAICQR